MNDEREKAEITTLPPTPVSQWVAYFTGKSAPAERFLKEMEEGIITNPADVDIGVIFGFGFPPFRGGLLREADRHGLAWVVETLDRYADKYGERLRPAELLREMGRRGEKFYKA